MIAETVLCLILGDSIAIGLHRFLPECEVRAKTGITTSAFAKLSNYEEINAPIVIISLGTNDLYSTRLLDQLNLVRKIFVAIVFIGCYPTPQQNVKNH